MKVKEVLTEAVDPRLVLKKIQRALPSRANISGFTLKARVKGQWKYVGDTGSGPTTALRQLERSLRQMKSRPGSELFVTYWLQDATRKTGPVNAMSYERKIPQHFLRV